MPTTGLDKAATGFGQNYETTHAIGQKYESTHAIGQKYESMHAIGQKYELTYASGQNIGHYCGMTNNITRSPI